MATSIFEKAKKNKADEFYTQLPDIEAEMRHYKEQFRGKVIFCNCDDPYESNFFKYFAMNFNFLGLKKLIATCYNGSPVAGGQLSLFGETTPAHKIEIAEVKDENADGAVDLADVEYLLKNKKNVLAPLDGGGDFRSDECIALLKEADIVVTNPPFSLFREYVAQLMEYEKKFIIIGSKNAISYKEVFKLIMENKLWIGNGFPNGNAFFRVPADYSREWASGVYNQETGLVKFRNVGWFTNLDLPKRHEYVTLYKQYTPEEYPTYANYDAIEVSKVSDIPMDYDGEMGVPITFLDKYNPEQFEIIGSSRALGKNMAEVAPPGTYVQGGIRFYLPEILDKSDNATIIGTERNDIPLSVRPNCHQAQDIDGSMTASLSEQNSQARIKYRCLYDRIVIKRKGAVQ
ncbi:MAG: adenine-specific methyltransferase EcoRI family protein [Clostridiales bacterium]|nr:adenine-specific methyltransferase EcoRI family protein [Clostridiales bacterium]